MTDPTTALELGQTLEVSAERLAFGGDAIARYEGLVVFVPFAAPGDRLRVEVTEVQRSHVRARVVELLAPGPDRVEPRCRHFGDCGGCQFQHVSYDAQVRAKAEFVQDALQRIGQFEWPQPVTVHRDEPWGYRSRTQLKLRATRGLRTDGHHGRLRKRERQALREQIAKEAEAYERDGRPPKQPVLGFHRAHSNTVIDLAECPVLVPELERGLADVRAAISQLPPREWPYQVEGSCGTEGASYSPDLPGMRKDLVEHEVSGFRYLIEPDSFFQGNRRLVQALVDGAIAEERGGLAFDLYAGVGLFSLPLSKRFERVVSVEDERRAATLGRVNVKTNGCDNVHYLRKTTEQFLQQNPRTARSGAARSAAPRRQAGAADAARARADAHGLRLVRPADAGARSAHAGRRRLRAGVGRGVRHVPADLPRRSRGSAAAQGRMIATRYIDVAAGQGERDARLAVHVAGRGPLALLIHGFPLDARMWLDAMHGPLAEVRTLCAIDLRGHGRSPWCGESVHTMERFADDVAAVIKAFGADDADVCGLSMGGYVAFALWARHRELVRSLVLTNTRAAADTEIQRAGREQAIAKVAAEGRGAIVDAMLPKLLAPSADALARARIRTMIEELPAESIVADQRGLQQREDRRGRARPDRRADAGRGRRRRSDHARRRSRGDGRRHSPRRARDDRGQCAHVAARAAGRLEPRGSRHLAMSFATATRARRPRCGHSARPPVRFSCRSCCRRR